MVFAAWRARHGAAKPNAEPQAGGARIHAVRHAPAPGDEPDPEQRTWFAIEATVSPPAAAPWRPADLAVGVPVSEDVWGSVYAARSWHDGAWAVADADAEPLQREQRVRLLVGIWRDEPPALVLRGWGLALAPLDLSRADEGGAEAVAGLLRFETAGECTACAAMTLLNGAGVCQPCDLHKRCDAHAEARSVGRCTRCRRPCCAACLVQGRCIGCASLPGTTRRPGRAPVAATLAAAGKGQPSAATLGKRVAIGVAVALVLVKAGLLLADQAAAPAPPSPEAIAHGRVAVVAEAATAYHKRHGRYPAKPSDLKAFMPKDVAELPTLAPDPAHAKPGDVTYTKTERGFAIQIRDEENQPFQVNGRVLELKPD